MGDTGRVHGGGVKRATSPLGVAVVPRGEWGERNDATGVLEGEELKAARAKRPTPARIAHVEERVDGHDDQLKELHDDVKSIVKKTGDLPARMDSQDHALERIEKLVDRVLDDQSHATRTKRERGTKWLGAALSILTSGVVIGAIAHWLASR